MTTPCTHQHHTVLAAIAGSVFDDHDLEAVECQGCHEPFMATIWRNRADNESAVELTPMTERQRAQYVQCRHRSFVAWRRIARCGEIVTESGQCPGCSTFLIAEHDRATDRETFRPMTDEEYERESPDPRTVVTSPWDER